MIEPPTNRWTQSGGLSAVFVNLVKAWSARRRQVSLALAGLRTNMTEPADCNSLHDRLIGQLDTLVPFLALAHHDIFTSLHGHYVNWVSSDQQDALPDTCDGYVTQVTHSAFLLGYSYAEAFVSDLMWRIYSERRDLLPQEKTLNYTDVLTRSDFTNLLRYMIDCTISGLNSLQKKMHHLQTRLNLGIEQPSSMLKAHDVRNALIHNAGIVNRDSTHSGRWVNGDRVVLTVSDVHDFGIMAREYTRDLCARASALCRNASG